MLNPTRTAIERHMVRIGYDALFHDCLVYIRGVDDIHIYLGDCRVVGE